MRLRQIRHRVKDKDGDRDMLRYRDSDRYRVIDIDRDSGCDSLKLMCIIRIAINANVEYAMCEINCDCKPWCSIDCIS